MEQLNNSQVNILNKIHNSHMEYEFSSSDSDQDSESRNSFGTSRSGASDVETPRSLTSDESSAVTSPRASLLWDHGFDVACGERKSPDDRDAEWKRFSNKTDDDKIIADKRTKIQENAHKLQEIEDRETKQNPKSGQGLPDLIPSACVSSVKSSVRSSQETLYALEDLDLPPPLPDSDPPNMGFSDSPPPLPTSSPPTLNLFKENDYEKNEETVENVEFDRVKNENKATGNDNTDSDDTSELCQENPLGVDLDSDESSSAAGDSSDEDADIRETNFDGFYNVQTHTVFRMESDMQKHRSNQEVIDDVEAEFDFILQSLDSDSESKETYIERFAGRRDRYGFILSPVVEAPSPTPSNMSSYSGYSGLSCSSPDPLGVFRMSPGPNRGSKQELDLSSLSIKANEWDLGNEQTVPIYQTVHAKKAFILPEGLGWDSGDDLLSPTGSGEWDCYDNGLSTPPISTSSVNLTQFGTHISGWKQPDKAIYEEPEDYNSDTTIDNEDDSDTDTTIDDESPRSNPSDLSKVTVTECESPYKNLYLNCSDMDVDKHSNTGMIENEVQSEYIHAMDETIQTLELSVLEVGINEVENELELLKIQTNGNNDLTETEVEEVFEIECNVDDLDSKKCVAANSDKVSLGSNHNDSFQEFSAEIAQINERNRDVVTNEQSQKNEDAVSINSSLDRICRKRIRVDSGQTSSTSDDESDTSEESDEDAEDEYSDSDNENDKGENMESDFELFKAKPVAHKENNTMTELDDLHDNDDVSVTEILSARSAILVAGGMFPEDTSSITSDDDLGDVTPDANMSSYGSGIKISQYTSGDSEDNCKVVMKNKTDNLENDSVRVNTQTSNDLSFIKKNSSSEQDDDVCKDENDALTKTIIIQSPLDFSILYSKFETSKRGELKNSPGIFGRYYAEMDDKLLEEVRSKFDSTETPISDPEIPKSLTTKPGRHPTLFEQNSTVDIDEFERSFMHVDITNLTDTCSNKNFVEGRKVNYRNDNTSIQHAMRNFQVNSDRCANVQYCKIHEITENESLNLDPVLPGETNDVKDEAIGIFPGSRHENIEVLEKQDIPLTEVKLHVPRNGIENSLQNKNKNVFTKSSPKKSPSLKIKIGHLARRGSASSKVKRGFVHEISELFDKSDGNLNGLDLQKTKTNRRSVEIERAQTPKIFTPNENMVIFEKISSDSFGDNDYIKTQESLGFEVTPLEKVTTFEDIPSIETRQRRSEGEISDNYNFDYSSDENSICMSDADSDDALKRYEDQLMELQADWKECDDDYKGEASVLEDTCIQHCDNSGTSEFTPKLDTFTEIDTCLQDQSFRDEIEEVDKIYVHDSDKIPESSDYEQGEIEESIDGDKDPDQSEDEDFHQRYFLPGHSHHINDTRNGTDFAAEKNQEGVATSVTDTIKHRFPEASNCEVVENDDIETSTQIKSSYGRGVDIEHSQRECRRYEDYKPEPNTVTPVVEQTASADEKAPRDEDHANGPEISDGCVTKSKYSTSNDSHVDMSNILWKIPWKPLKERKQEQSTVESAKHSHKDTRKQPGYLYDLISRINMEPKNMAAEIGFQENVGYNNKSTGIQNVTKDSAVSFNVQDKISQTAVSEKGEFDFLEEPADNMSCEIKTAEGKDYLPRKQHVYEYDDDPRFKIRYPSSLSRRLYGPYCRLRSNEAALFENENERETNLPVLIQNSESNINTMSDGDLSYVFCQRREGLNRKNKPYSFTRKEHEYYCENNGGCLHNIENHRLDGESPVLGQSSISYGENSDTDSPTDNSSIHLVHSDDRNFNPNHFYHTCYDVKTPFSSITQRDSIKFNKKAIIGGKRSQAQRKPLVCENNFVIVNLQHERNEANTDKQECDSRKSAYYGDDNCDVEFTKLPMHLECRSVQNKYVHDNSGGINNNNLGVDSNIVAVKNDDHYTALGVHIPLELSANESKQQNVDMNNDFVSTSRIVSTVKTNKPGINRISASVTTQNINSHPMSSGDAVTDDNPVSNGDNKSPGADEGQISRASVVLQSPGFQHVLEDERGKLRVWPYSDFDNSDKLPVTLHRVRKGINIPVKKGMSSTKSNMTVIQSAEHSAEMPENRVVHKYHSSSILPADRTTGQIMKAHGESVQSVLLQDTNGNNVSEEEIASVLPKIAESISKMDSSNADEILPGISQSITKLKNGGNLVITTMTRKLDEDESSSSGRGSPEPDYPVLNVDDLENSKIYLVQDSKGELFYVEDVTSETQESAYFSSRNTSESVSDTGNSPTFDRISKINSVGDSGINESTAQEILTAMYGDSGVKEMTENEEEWSERTYEYSVPRRRDSGTQKPYSKDSFKTSYMVEEPGDTLPRLKTATAKDRYDSSYQMSGGSPWVYDGGMAQSYSQVTQGVFLDEANSVSAASTQNVDNSGVKTIERYTIEGEAIDYPAPVPVFVPPMVVQTDVPQYSLVKVDVTPKYKDEGVMAQIEAPKPEEPAERPIYKTVAHIQTPEKVPSPKPIEKKKYKIIASKATEREEEQETHMRFDEIDYKFSAENVEYTMKPATAETQYFVKNSSKIQPQSQFRSEKRIELGKSSDQRYKSQIQVQEPKQEVYEKSSYSYDQMKSELEQSESNMRVVRGSYLIKNTLDDADTALDDNINMFDNNFTMCKDNPLYHSDEDLYRRLERERIEGARRRQEILQRDLNQDISFETVDRFSKSKTVKHEPEKPRQSIYEMLMCRLSTIDAKDIRQNIDVKHNAEDIYGDPRFLQADGEYLQNIAGTNNFETVGEKVDLMLKEGKAYITVKVTAEKITPVDLEFNVWRKNQAIVTRTIEVDLLATEHRRRLYYKVMDEPAGVSRGGYRAGPNETVLDSKETLELFTKILGAADGEGDIEDIEVKTRSGKTTRPFSSGMDLLY